MRVLASTTIVEHADKVARMIVNNYLVPNKTFPELRDMVNSGAIDPLRDFSEASREEFQRLGFIALRASAIAPAERQQVR